MAGSTLLSLHPGAPSNDLWRYISYDIEVFEDEIYGSFLQWYLYKYIPASGEWIHSATTLGGTPVNGIEDLIVYNSGLYANGYKYLAKLNATKDGWDVLHDLGGVIHCSNYTEFNSKLYFCSLGNLYKLNDAEDGKDLIISAAVGVTQVDRTVIFEGSLYCAGDGQLQKLNDAGSGWDVLFDDAAIFSFNDLAVYNDELYMVCTGATAGYHNGLFKLNAAKTAWVRVGDPGGLAQEGHTLEVIGSYLYHGGNELYEYDSVMDTYTHLVTIGAGAVKTDNGLMEYNGTIYWSTVGTQNSAGGRLYVLNNHIAADFTATPLSGVAPLEVSFTNTTYNSYPSGNYLWTFGDGNTSTLTNPIHTYTAVGLYTVSLSGYYSTNYSIRTKNDYITVGNFVPATGVLPQFQSVAGGKILEPPRRRQNVLDPIDPHKRRDETIGSLTGSSPTQTGTGKGGRYNKHGYVPGAFMFNTAIKQMRDHVEFEKFLCRTLKDDERTKQFKKNTQEHPESRYRLIYNNEAVEDHTAAGKKKRRDANRRQESQ